MVDREGWLKYGEPFHMEVERAKQLSEKDELDVDEKNDEQGEPERQPQELRYSLRFELPTYAPKAFLKRWVAFILSIGHSESEERATFLDEWKRQAVLEVNKQRPILKRMDGVFGGNNNQTDKQLRWRCVHLPGGASCGCDRKQHLVCFVARSSWDDKDKWTIEELVDLKNAFIKAASKRLAEDNCCDGFVAIE